MDVYDKERSTMKDVRLEDMPHLKCSAIGIQSWEEEGETWLEK